MAAPVPATAVSAKLFIEPQAGGLSLAYVAYRVSVAIYFLSVLVWSILAHGFDRMLLLYLTNWTFVLQTLHIIIQAALVARLYVLRLMHRDTSDLEERPLPLLLRVDWVLHNITLSMSLVVSFVYWTIVYDGLRLELVTVTTHAANSVCVLIDLSITSIPVELTHIYQPIAYGLTYVFATFVYWLAGGVDPNGFNYIYPILDYSGNPTGSLAVVVVTTVATALIHCAMCWLSRLRSRCLPGKSLPIDAGKTDSGVHEVRLGPSDNDVKLFDVAALPQDTTTQSTEIASRVASSVCPVASKPDRDHSSLDDMVAAPVSSTTNVLASLSDDRSSTKRVDILSPAFTLSSHDAYMTSLPDIGRLLLDVASVSSNVKMSSVSAALTEVVSLPGIVRAISEYTVAFVYEPDIAGID